MELYDIAYSTTLESNKSLNWIVSADFFHHTPCFLMLACQVFCRSQRGADTRRQWASYAPQASCPRFSV